MRELSERVIQGDVRAVARVCRLVDDRVTGYDQLLRELYPHGGNAWILGITGNPGSGKSTLTDRLIQQFRAQGRKIAVLAVDPTSPFTGGALLGDRIRMQRHFEDPEVFIRSLATRGALGGLSRSASDLIRVLDAWRADVVLVETVGVGQDELEVTRAAHTTLVVVAPGLGDDIQAAKAGILECADVFAVNKADRDGALATERDLQLMIALASEVPLRSATRHSAATFGAGTPAHGASAERWVPPVVRCVATRAEGIDELVRQLQAHRAWLCDSEQGRARRQLQSRDHLVQYLRDALTDEAVTRLASVIDESARRIEAREIDPYAACDELLQLFRALR